jgi:hypothetical protein
MLAFTLPPPSLKILRFNYPSLSKLIIILKTPELTFSHIGTFHNRIKSGIWCGKILTLNKKGETVELQEFETDGER